MRTIAACALAALLLLNEAGCSSSTRTGHEAPPVYVLTVVSGDGQHGPAVIQPVTVSVGPSAPATQAAPGTIPPTLPEPLVVEVTDRRGRLVDGVLVRFASFDGGVMGLGTGTSGVDNGPAFLSSKGEVGLPATPYLMGTHTVTCSVDTSAGSSNTVVFTVTGT